MIKCYCCGREITSPNFYNGFPYGYSCVKKINPSFKKKYKKSSVFKVEKISFSFNNVRSTRGWAIVMYDNNVKRVPCYRELDENLNQIVDVEFMDIHVVNGDLYIVINNS